MAKQSFPKPGDEEELREKIAAGSTEYEDYTKLGFIEYAKGQYDDAVAFCQKALTLPLTEIARAKVSNELGWLFNAIGQPAQTQALAQNTINLLSNQPEIPQVFLYRGESHALLAHSLFWMEENVSGEEAAQIALTWLQRAIFQEHDVDEIASAYWISANLYILLEDTAKAITLCETCLQHQLGEVDRFGCLSALGEALLRQNKFMEAGRVIEDALQFSTAGKTQLIWCHFGRGIVQRSTGRLPEAIGTFQKVLATVTDDSVLQRNSHILGDTYLNMGATYYDLQQYSNAVEAMQKVLACHSKDNLYRVNALLWLSHCYKEMGIPPKALECLEEMLASPHASEKDKADARETWAHLNYETGSYEKAAAVFKELLVHCAKDDPRRHNLLLWLGHSYGRTKSFSKARECFEEMLASSNALDKDKADAQRGLANLDYESGRYKEAATAYQQALAYYGNDDSSRSGILLWLGYCYQRIGSSAKARDCFEETLASPHASSDEKGWARSGLARLDFEAGNYQKAAAAFQRVLVHRANNDSEHFCTLLWLGRCYEQIGTSAEARECFEQVVASAYASADDKAYAHRSLVRLPPAKTPRYH